MFVVLVVVIVLIPLALFTILSWALLPDGFVAAAWPAFALLMSSVLLTLPMALLRSLHERWMDRADFAHLPESAAEWLRGALERLGLTGVEVVHCERQPDAFHPASSSIILRASTYAEHTVRARGIAAHELGHAAFFHFSPRLDRLALACRRWSDRLGAFGFSMLIASALIAAPHLRSIAFAILAASAAMSIVVVADEAGASLRATRLLRRELEPAPLRALVTARVLGLMAYAVQLAPAAIALIFWPQLCALLGPGVVEPAAPLSGWSATLAQLGAIAVSAAAIGCLWGALRPKARVVEIVSSFALMMIGPAFTFAVAGQAEVLAQPWALALAACWAWRLPALPVTATVSWGARLVSRGLDLVAPVTRFIDGPQLQSLGQAERDKVPASSLARHERRSIADRLWSARWALLSLPLVFAYWGLLG